MATSDQGLRALLRAKHQGYNLQNMATRGTSMVVALDHPVTQLLMTEADAFGVPMQRWGSDHVLLSTAMFNSVLVIIQTAIVRDDMRQV